MLTRLVAIVTLIQAVCYVNCNNLHHYGSHACGSDHEDVQTLERAAVTVPLAYRPVAAPPTSRRAQAAFVTVGEADAVGATARIRIHIDWGMLESGNDDQQCQREGGQLVVSGNAFTCRAVDLVTPGSPRYRQLQNRTEWAAAYWSRTLRLKPVVGPLTIDPSLITMFPRATASVPNSDLSVIVTARPIGGDSVSAFAVCLQRDQHGRCTVGWLNWVPSYLNTEHGMQPDVVFSERETAVHELVHILGGMRPSASFVDVNGNSVMPDNNVQAGLGIIYTVDNGEGGVVPDGGASRPYFDKPTTWIITPRVKALAREQFGCDSLKGLPLEDTPQAGGAGSHWESRIMGPEIMSYGRSSGEVYISSITLAFLEDTEQYRANYSMAGPLRRLTRAREDPLACDGSSSSASIDFAFGIKAPRVIGNMTVSAPGSITWGYKEGCAFVTGSPEAWPRYYLCDTDEDTGCSADNRMIAKCAIRTDWSFSSSAASWGDVRINGPTLSTTGCPSSGCALHPMFQFLPLSADRNGKQSRSGGVSQPMDFVPTFQSSWNCQDMLANVEFDDSVWTTASDLSAIAPISGPGGAAGDCHCSTCRCMKSSLIDVTSASVMQPQATGQCYKTNCVNANYLQIATRDPMSGLLRWYHCPSDGGKLYIPGYAGFLRCPAPATFCKLETLSGVKYPESSAWQIWLALSCALALPSLACCCCACPCLRRRLCRRAKQCCFLSMFKKPVNRTIVRSPSPVVQQQKQTYVSTHPNVNTVYPSPIAAGTSPLAGQLIDASDIYNSPRNQLSPVAGHASPVPGRFSPEDLPRPHSVIIVSPASVNVPLVQTRASPALRASPVPRGRRPRRTIAATLIIVSIVSFVIQLALLIMMIVLLLSSKIALTSAPMLLLMLLLCGTSVLGTAAASKRSKSVSCSMASFLFCALLACIILSAMALAFLVSKQYLRAFVADNWSVFVVVLSPNFDHSATPTEQLRQSVAYLYSILPAILFVILAQVTLYGIGIRQVVRSVGSVLVSGMFLSVLPLLQIAVGFSSFSSGILMDTTSFLNGAAMLQSGLGLINAICIVLGLVNAAAAVVLLLSTRRRALNVMNAAGLCSLGLAALYLALSMTAFASSKQAAQVAAIAFAKQATPLISQAQLQYNVHAFCVVTGIMLLAQALCWTLLSGSTAVFLRELKYDSCWSRAALRAIGTCCKCCATSRAHTAIEPSPPQDTKHGESRLAIHAGSELDGGPESSPESGSVAPSPAATPRRVDTTRARVCVVGSPRRDPVEEMFSPQSHASDSPLLQADGSPLKDGSIAREPSHVTVMRVLVTPPPLLHALHEDERFFDDDETPNTSSLD